jgi:hypothetical protein
MLDITAGEREYLTEMRSLGVDAQGNDILVGLNVEESKIYLDYGNARVHGHHPDDDERDRYLELYEKHELVRRAIIVAEAESRNDTSLRQ